MFPLKGMHDGIGIMGLDVTSRESGNSGPKPDVGMSIPPGAK